MSDSPTPASPQGFAIIPRWLLYRDDLSVYAKLAYAVISAHANASGSAWPSLATIAAKGSMSRKSAQRGTRELIELGAVERTYRTRRDGGQGSNIYRIVVEHPDAPVDGPVD